MKSARTSWPLAVVILTFLLSRAVAYVVGIRMVLRPLYQGIQILDPQLLRHHLLESIFYLHSQPPLFNLFLGTVLKAFPVHFGAAFQVFYWIAGLFLVTGLYTLMRRLQVPPWLACGLTAYFTVNPTVILLENWLFYTYLIMPLLVWAAVFLHRFVSDGRNSDGHALFILMGVLVLTKGIFHLFWYLFITLVIIFSRRVPLKKVLSVSVLPLVICTTVYAKNLILFGSLTTSRVWMVYGLGGMAVRYIPAETLAEYCRAGRISLVACGRPLGYGSAEYRRRVADFELKADLRPTGIAVLDQVQKPTSGLPNWHSQRFLASTDLVLADSLFLLREHPEAYLMYLRQMFRMMFYPAPTDVTFPNRRFLETYENVYNWPFAWENHINGGTLYTEKLLLWYEFERRRTDALSCLCLIGVMLFYAMIFLGGIKLFMQARYRGAEARVTQVLLFFMLFHIFYVPFISNFFSWLAGNRYRFVIEPFNLAVMAVILTACFKGQGRKSSGSGAPHTDTESSL
ncbi:MAG: hypothetical protein KC900_09525 [Candidatus Omnitrophica bacterium]|nr:hypothetical protein [Candidatus Omnitrophota bacterium]